MTLEEICVKNSIQSVTQDTYMRSWNEMKKWRKRHEIQMLYFFDILYTVILNWRGSWHVNNILFFDNFLTLLLEFVTTWEFPFYVVQVFVFSRVPRP